MGQLIFSSLLGAIKEWAGSPGTRVGEDFDWLKELEAAWCESSNITPLGADVSGIGRM